MEEVVGKTDFDFYGEEHARPAFEDEQEIIRTGQPVAGKIEAESWKGSGKVTWVLTNKLPLRDAEGKIIGTVGISKDITALKEAEQAHEIMEARLRQSQKLEAVGQLAAGIAHEITAPVQSVGGSAQLLQNSLADIARVLQAQDELLRAAKTSSDTPEWNARTEALLAAGGHVQLCADVQRAIAETLEGVERITRIICAMNEFSRPAGEEAAETDVSRTVELSLPLPAAGEKDDPSAAEEKSVRPRKRPAAH